MRNYSYTLKGEILQKYLLTKMSSLKVLLYYIDGSVSFCRVGGTKGHYLFSFKYVIQVRYRYNTADGDLLNSALLI